MQGFFIPTVLSYLVFGANTAKKSRPPVSVIMSHHPHAMHRCGLLRQMCVLAALCKNGRTDRDAFGGRLVLTPGIMYILDDGPDALQGKGHFCEAET